MATTATADRALPKASLWILAAFTSAFLVFLVQPMVGKLLLPQLGGSPAVWNTSMAFFQACLLLGYGYAHWLQRLPIRKQVVVHGIALVAGVACLPLRISAFGAPSPQHPNLWLLGALLLSIGPAFTVLSATAPLIQSWRARSGDVTPEKAYALYAASNAGSLLALLAYPVLFEPTLSLWTQRYGWSAGYLLFAALLMALSAGAARGGLGAPASPSARSPAPSWRLRGAWVLLAAAPSSLMLGLTAYVATDIASAPFLWVAPLALYLLTFILAFQEKPSIRLSVALVLQAPMVMAAAYCMYLPLGVAGQVAVQGAAFLLTALVCHQTLVAHRPEPDRLTEFYLCLALGGVLGGGFNAFVAPVVFNDVVEYPLVLALALLARPLGRGPYSRLEWGALVLGVLALVAMFLARGHLGDGALADVVAKLVLGALIVGALGLRNRALLLFALASALLIGSRPAGSDEGRSDRSFFGVLKEKTERAAPLGGDVRLLIHGTTVHGAQALDKAHRCRPLTYYTPMGAIGGPTAALLNGRGPSTLGVVGLGAGAMATYARPGDRLVFFEIDPMVIDIADRSGRFTYTRDCAAVRPEFVVGDARLTLSQVNAQFDVLVIDAFSSDSVPAHLLTTEALRLYASRLKPDGVLILHTSNRHMDLNGPALAAARRAGLVAKLLAFHPSPDQRAAQAYAQEAIVAARSGAVVDRVAGTAGPGGAMTAAWTDDYTNILGAIVARARARAAEPER